MIFFPSLGYTTKESIKITIENSRSKTKKKLTKITKLESINNTLLEL